MTPFTSSSTPASPLPTPAPTPASAPSPTRSPTAAAFDKIEQHAQTRARQDGEPVPAPTSAPTIYAVPAPVVPVPTPAPAPPVPTPVAPMRSVNVESTSAVPAGVVKVGADDEVIMSRDGNSVPVNVNDVEAHGRMGWKLGQAETFDVSKVDVVKVTPEALAASRADE